jgi:hypothetical protein
VDLSYLTVQQPEFDGSLHSRLSLHTIFSLYRQQFRRWFAITAPTSLIGSFVLWIADDRIRTIYRSFPILEIQYHVAEQVQAGLLRFGSFFISWLLGCFALAAIATVLNGFDVSEGESAWQSDSHQRAREHFGQIFFISLFTFGAFLAGMAAMELIIVAIARVVGWGHFGRFSSLAGVVGYVVIAGILSWFGMAIPLILGGKLGAWAALKRSVKISNGYEGLLFLLVVESVIGSYVAWYAVRFGLPLLIPASLTYNAWYGWVVFIVSILAAAAVEPPMFIGFSLLAGDEHQNSSPLPDSQKSAHID